MRLVRISIPPAACLLLASALNATAESQTPKTTMSMSGASTQVAAEHEPNSILVEEDNPDTRLSMEDLDKNLSGEEHHFRQANFGPDDPGVTVIANNDGGVIGAYESAFFGPGSGNRLWAVDGYCNSACTMVLGTGRVCATSRAQFGFHAGWSSLLLFTVVAPQATYQMYRHYPEDVKTWVDAHHAMDQMRMTMMGQPEVASYVPTCKRSAPDPQVHAQRAPAAEPYAGPNGPQVYSPVPQPYTGPYAPQGSGLYEPHVSSGQKGRMRWIIGPQPYGM
jgi:hypothetical protein